jgi:DNA-binding NarL/FixJ family response regulator
MTKVAIQCVFLVIDNEEQDARKCFAVLRPFLNEQGINVQNEYFVTSVTGGCERLKSEHGCDAILLDIKGVDEDKKAIDRLHAINAYVPIIMMSNQYTGQDVRAYQDLGSRTFIPKDCLRTDSSSRQSKWESRRNTGEQQDKQIREIAECLRRIIDDYRPIKELMNRNVEGSGWVTKREEVTKGTDNVDYLEGLQTSRCGSVFPKVLHKNPEGTQLEYGITYFDLTTLRSVVLDGTQPDFCEGIVNIGIRKVIEFLVSEMYLDSTKHDHERSRIGEIITGRVTERLETARRDVIKGVETATQNGEAELLSQWMFLKDLLNRQSLIDDKASPLRAPDGVISDLKNDTAFIDRMFPPFLARIHGDLHFGNIMIDGRLPKAVRFRLIDPKRTKVWGPSGFNDPAYDFGKMFQSTSGYYDFIQAGYLRPNFSTFGRCALVRVPTIERELHGLSGAKVTTTRVQQNQQWKKEVFRKGANFIEEIIGTQTRYVAQDPDWLFRARFYEAAHMLSVTPLHLPDVSLASAVFIRGIELLNDFYNRYASNQFPDRRSKGA